MSLLVNPVSALRGALFTGIVAAGTALSCSKVEMFYSDKNPYGEPTTLTKGIYDENITHMKPVMVLDSLYHDLGVLGENETIRSCASGDKVIEFHDEDGNMCYHVYDYSKTYDLGRDTLFAKYLKVNPDWKELSSDTMKIYRKDNMLHIENCDNPSESYSLKRENNHSWDKFNGNAVIAKMHNTEPRTFNVDSKNGSGKYYGVGVVDNINQISFQPIIVDWKNDTNTNAIL